MKLSFIDIGTISIFFLFNLVMLKLLDSELLRKNSSVFDMKNVTIALFNTVIIGFPMMMTSGLYIYTIIAFTVYLVELISFYKTPSRKNVFITSFITFNVIAIDNIVTSCCFILLHNLSYDQRSRIAISTTFILILLFVFVAMKKFKSGVIDIVTGNRIQAKFSNAMMLSSIIILNIISAFESAESTTFFNLSNFVLTIFFLFVTYLSLVYGYNVSLDIWNNASKNITTADLEGNSNAEFDLSMFRNVDVLSGLYNKEFGYEKLKKYLDGDTMFCLVFININNFERVKSEFGQEWQDKYVKVVAETLKATYRDNDFMFRFSDSKFMVILENCPTIAGEKTTSRAYNRVRQYGKEVDSNMNMSISFGCQEYYPNSGTTIVDIENTSATKMGEFNLKKNDIMDNVSGTYNKKFGLNVLEDVCYKKQDFTICTFQINQLKAIETMYGDDEMNEMISIIGNTVIESFRARDTVSRFTESQFISIMPFCDAIEAKEVYETVYQKVLEVFKKARKPYGIDITYNITEYKNDSDMTPNQVFIKIQDKLDELLKTDLATRK